MKKITKFIQNNMIYSVPIATMPTVGESVKGFQGDFISLLPGISIILLVVTLYFVSSATKIYGGKIGHSLNMIGIGIFVIALKELFYFSSLVAYDSSLKDLLSDASFIYSLNYITNIVIFMLFSYGFYSMTRVFKSPINNKKKKEVK